MALGELRLEVIVDGGVQRRGVPLLPISVVWMALGGLLSSGSVVCLLSVCQIVAE